MSRHLASCAKTHDGEEGKPAPPVRLHMEAAGELSCWLDVEVNAEACLRVLAEPLEWPCAVCGGKAA